MFCCSVIVDRLDRGVVNPSTSFLWLCFKWLSVPVAMYTGRVPGVFVQSFCVHKQVLVAIPAPFFSRKTVWWFWHKGDHSVCHHRCRVRALHNTEFKLFCFQGSSPGVIASHITLKQTGFIVARADQCKPCGQFDFSLIHYSLLHIAYIWLYLINACRLSVHLSPEVSPGHSAWED